MKKIAVLIAFTSLFLSCSGNDTSDPVQQDLVIKQILQPGTSLAYQNFTYVDNKLYRINSLQEYKEFTYTGNLITHISLQRSGYGVSYTYSYDESNRLTSLRETSAGEFGVGPTYETDYQYNPDNTIYFATLENGEAFSSGLFYLDNNQVYRKVTDFADGATSQIIDYTFDSKNFYAKNILGYDKIAFTGIIGAAGLNNNMTLTTYSSATSSEYQVDYTYNTDDYPVTATVISDGTPVGTVQYIYE